MDRAMRRGRLRYRARVGVLLLLAAACYAPSARTAPCPARNERTEAVALDISGGCLHGTLTLPHGPAPHPLVIILAGSGPTDGDGNGPGLRPDAYLQLAEALRRHGIASLRYDKRGVAQSAAAMKSETELRFDDYIEDAAAWLRHTRADRRFNRRYLLGHSEGSSIALLAAGKQPVDGVIAVAGPGRPMLEVLREQLTQNLGPEKAAPGLRILDRIAAGETVSEMPLEWMPFFRPSVQPYLRSENKYDPARAIAALAVPILIVQGRRDLQVSVRDAELLARANPRATLHIIDSMNHVLKTVPADQRMNLRAYEVPEFPLAPELVVAIKNFVAVGPPEAHPSRPAAPASSP